MRKILIIAVALILVGLILFPISFFSSAVNVEVGKALSEEWVNGEFIRKPTLTVYLSPNAFHEYWLDWHRGGWCSSSRLGRNRPIAGLL